MVDGDTQGGRGSSFRALNHAHPGTVSPPDSAQPRAPQVDAMPRDMSPRTSDSSHHTASHSANVHLVTERDAQQTCPAPSATTQSAAPSQSQSQSATMSASAAPANAPAQDDTPASTSGYGTRSRNRPGTARINYAEDVEMDFEMPAAATATPTNVCHTIYDDYAPRLVIPDAVRDLVPLWKNCDACLEGVIDPPIPLKTADSLLKRNAVAAAASVPRETAVGRGRPLSEY